MGDVPTTEPNDGQSTLVVATRSAAAATAVALSLDSTAAVSS